VLVPFFLIRGGVLGQHSPDHPVGAFHRIALRRIRWRSSVLGSYFFEESQEFIAGELSSVIAGQDDWCAVA
jgi:hypothetical protein